MRNIDKELTIFFSAIFSKDIYYFSDYAKYGDHNKSQRLTDILRTCI